MPHHLFPAAGAAVGPVVNGGTTRKHLDLAVYT